MSDSDLMKTEEPGRSPPTPKMELLSPSKVKDRSQNVTERVTQVWGRKAEPVCEFNKYI